jgi:hypothetical protein
MKQFLFDPMRTDPMDVIRKDYLKFFIETVFMESSRNSDSSGCGPSCDQLRLLHDLPLELTVLIRHSVYWRPSIKSTKHSAVWHLHEPLLHAHTELSYGPIRKCNDTYRPVAKGVPGYSQCLYGEHNIVHSRAVVLVPQFTKSGFRNRTHVYGLTRLATSLHP